MYYIIIIILVGLFSSHAIAMNEPVEESSTTFRILSSHSLPKFNEWNFKLILNENNELFYQLSEHPKKQVTRPDDPDSPGLFAYTYYSIVKEISDRWDCESIVFLHQETLFPYLFKEATQNEDAPGPDESKEQLQKFLLAYGYPNPNKENVENNQLIRSIQLKDKLMAEECNKFKKENYKKVEGCDYRYIPINNKKYQLLKHHILIQYNPLDFELSTMLADYYFAAARYTEALSEEAKTLTLIEVIKPIDRKTLLLHSNSYLFLLEYYIKDLEKEKISTALKRILLFLEVTDNSTLSFQSPRKPNKLTARLAAQKLLNGLVSDCKTILCFLKDNIKDGCIKYINLDVFFQVIWRQFLAKEYTLENDLYFIDQLWKELGNKIDNCLPSLRIVYAQTLAQRKRFKEAVNIYKSVFNNETNNFKNFHIPHFYIKFIYSLYYINERTEALDLLKKIAFFNVNSPIDKWEFVIISILLDSVSEKTLTILESLIGMTPEATKEENLRESELWNAYIHVLCKLGKTEILDQLVLSEQQAALKKAVERQNKQAEQQQKQSERVKAGITQQREQQQKQAHLKRTITKTTTTSATTTITSMSVVSANEKEEYVPTQEKEKYVPTQKKVKVKTRGEPNLQEGAAQIIPASLENIIKFTTIQELTRNKHAWKTFETLFEIYPKESLEAPLCFKNTPISFTNVRWLFKSLEKDKEAEATPASPKIKKVIGGIDTSKAKGSHTKAYLEFDSDMYEKDMKSQEMKKVIFTFSKSQYLKEYNLEQLRNGFIKAGIFPNTDNPDIIKQLWELKKELCKD